VEEHADGTYHVYLIMKMYESTLQDLFPQLPDGPAIMPFTQV
jgi:hypothetical protein